VNLRMARIDDHWRRALARNYPTRFAQIRLQNLPCIADCSINFTGGMTAIIGSNGVGKSTLVAAITELLSNGSEAVMGYQDRLVGSRIAGSAFREDIERRMEISEDEAHVRTATGDKFDGEFRWLDPSGLSALCLRHIHTDQNFDDLLESVTPLQLNSEELELVSYLVSRRYTELSVFEISDYGELDVFPYFGAVSSGVKYGSEGMGRGELALLLTYWTLRDLSRNSILVIEEPETHVSPRSQDTLMNILSKFAEEMGIWIIVATHSPTVIRRLPATQVKLITRESARSGLIENPTKTQIATILGGGVAYRGVVLVEDATAKAFLSGILEELDADLLPQFEIVSAESMDGITQAIVGMPPRQKQLTIVGVYDGDVRSTLRINPAPGWPYIFLPGDHAPEELLSALLHTPALLPDVAAELHKTEAQVRLALDHTDGMDHHDLIPEFSRAMGADAYVVRHGLVHLWLGRHENLQAAKAFVQTLNQVINNLHRA
jgi:predicted ATPase